MPWTTSRFLVLDDFRQFSELTEGGESNRDGNRNAGGLQQQVVIRSALTTFEVSPKEEESREILWRAHASNPMIAHKISWKSIFALTETDTHSGAAAVSSARQAGRGVVRVSMTATAAAKD